MAAVSVSSVEELDKILSQASSTLVVVHFWAPWSEHCSQMNEVLDDLASEYLNVKFVKLEAESLPDVSMKYDIKAVPTFLFFKNNKDVDRLDGANSPELVKKIKHHSSTFVAPVTEQSKTDDLNVKLKALVNSCGCLLFMKGTPEEPRCGFSRQIIQILNNHGVKYNTFNILADEEVRQGLKIFSNWPTYPQLYCNGELLGGLDIVKELAETGELDSMVPKNQDLNERLKSLTCQSNTVVFMKGSPEAPRCGFTRQLCEIFSSYPDLKYSSFDILQDQEVREGLKKYSNWPTYPQVYVKGELIGGLDIVKELHESGELQDMLSAT